MPRGDGTGPFGQGPGTGRRMGGCSGRGPGRGMFGTGRGRRRNLNQGIENNSYTQFSANQPLQPQNQVYNTTVNKKAMINKDKCTGCGICIDICPYQAIILNDVARVNLNKCNGCALCIDKCPNHAISLANV